ncbi:hypothetical protein D3C87_2147400 [compost metagenome]
MHRANVEAVAEVAQTVAVGVDHRDVVGLARKVFGERTAHLARAENDDLHC